MKLFALSVLSVFVLTTPASAIPMFSLIWQDTGTSSINVSSTVQETIVADVVIQLDAGDSTIGVFFSFLFDEDLGDELNFVSLHEGLAVDMGTTDPWSAIVQGGGVGTFDKQESTATLSGSWGGFEVVGPWPVEDALGPLTVTLGSVVFNTNPGNVATDGDDVRVGFTDLGVDGYVFTGGVCTESSGGCTFALPYASVNVPEPRTGVLVALGLALGWWSTRRNG